MGWANHEGLWRNNDPEVAARAALVRALYSAPNPALALTVLQEYNVEYVVLGDMERRAYPAASALTSYPFLTQVLPGGTAIYRAAGVP
jgi:uncharacterized membrane protein